MSQPAKRSRQNTIVGYGFILLSIIGIISGIGQIWSSGKVGSGLTTILFGVVFIVVGIMRLRVKSTL